MPEHGHLSHHLAQREVRCRLHQHRLVLQGTGIAQLLRDNIAAMSKVSSFLNTQCFGSRSGLDSSSSADQIRNWYLKLLTLTLPSSNYYTSPPSLSTSNLPLPFPAISFVFYIILPSEVKFYPQVGSTLSRFCRHSGRVYCENLPSYRITSKAFIKIISCM
jgi:hypothetical protein